MPAIAGTTEPLAVVFNRVDVAFRIANDVVVALVAVAFVVTRPPLKESSVVVALPGTSS